jgi:hypothetical protein
LNHKFKIEIKDEASCYLLSNTAEEGACTFGESCKLTTLYECTKLKGTFNSGVLCSAEELKTNCKPQVTVGCAEGKDEIYWFDSCGNRENIYDSSNKGLNGGKILAKSESCALGTSSNPFAYQGTCGNCFYLTGSRCGIKTKTEKLADSSKNVVCRDLTCKDENGNRRQNGESWCAYDGSIGTDTGSGGYNRSTVPVGSESVRNVCVDREVEKEECNGFRSEVCIESQKSKNSDAGNKVSYAACKPNDGEDCLDYNFEETEELRNEQCRSNAGCFIKQVKLGKDFQFQVCASKYPLGFQYSDSTTKSKQKKVCSLGTQTCKIVYLKGTLFNSRKCVRNCECLNREAFNEQMNDLCISLGDCGIKTNQIGEMGYGFSASFNGATITSEIKKLLSKSYIDKIKSYADPVPGNFIELADYYSNSSVVDHSESIDFVKRTQGDIARQFRDGKGLIGNIFQRVFDVKTLGGPAVLTYSVAEELDLSPVDVALRLADPSSIIYAFIGAIETEDITFTCRPWQAPVGGAKCGECGKSNVPCSKYSCQSIGQNCELINEDTSEESCVNIDPGDLTSPVISPLEGVLPEGYAYYDVGDSGFKVKSNFSEGCIETYKNINISIKTDEPSQCRMSANKTEFDDMDYFGDGNFFIWNHTTTISIPSLESLGLTSYDPTRKADFNLIVKCMDKSGNKGMNDYVINFCVKPGQDISPPFVSRRVPAYEYVAFNATSVNLSVYTNEPSECKYDIIDSAYDKMKNIFSCNNGVREGSSLGWKCNNIWNVGSESKKYYIKCKDQPWLTPSKDGISPGKIRVYQGRDDNDEDIYREIEVPATWTRNTMEKSYELVIRRSPNPLTISSIKPDGTISSGTAPATVKISATTAGGVDGKANCRYTIKSDYTPLLGDNFAVQETVSHKANVGLFAGEHYLTVSCEDLAGNIVEGYSTFVVYIDNTPPQITRVFKQNNYINLITDEYSKCFFVSNPALGCDFSIYNSTNISGDKLTHTINMGSGGDYYVKCMDNYGNAPTDCTLHFRGADIK